MNRAPVIQAVVLSANGQRLRYAPQGARLEVRVVAKDPEGDPLEYRWISEPDSGRVTVSGPGRARWAVPPGEARLRIRVADSRGRMVERVVSAESDPHLRYGGIVVDPNGKPIAGVTVGVDGAETRTDAMGRFSLTLPDRGQKRFVLNLSHPEFGPASLVTEEPVQAGRWTLARAAVMMVNLQQPMSVQVTAGSCASIPSSRVSWPAFPKQHAAVRVTAMRAYTAALPAELAATLQWAEGLTSCPGGFMMRAGANAFGSSSGNGAVALSQIPAWGGASMPGDYTVRTSSGQRRVMESFGAGSVRVSAGGRPLQLARGQKATLSWPVDSAFLRVGIKPAAELPLLRYDESVGEWDEIGAARLDPAGSAWTVEVDHLSTFNLDLVKADQACVRVDASALGDPSIELEVTIPRTGFGVVRTKILDNSAVTLHVLYNLPTNTMIALRPFRNVTGTLTPLGTFLINTGGPQVPTDPNQPDFPYDACQAEVALLDLGASVSIVEHGDGPLEPGFLVPVYIGVVNPADGDLYPAGSSGFPVVGIFDNGSTSIYLSDLAPNGFSGSSSSDVALLGVSHGLDATIRVTPVDLAASPAMAPMDGPGGAAPADAEVTGMKIKVTTSTPRNLSLLGAPFAVQYLAWVDYGRAVAIPGSSTGETGAWSRFYAAGETGYALPEITLPMERFGISGSSPYSVDRRFLLKGVTFYHGARAVGHAVPGSTDQIWYDIGSTWSAIGGATAMSLGLTDAEIIGPCFAAGSLFRIDRVEFVGIGGRYVVNDAMVCRDDASMVPVMGNPAQAMVGTNLFRRMAVVVDGPGNSFGILRP